MSEYDQTMISGREPQASYEPPPPVQPMGEPPKNKNKMLIFGGIGCVVLLCLALAVGGGVYYFMGGETLAGLTGNGETPVTVEILPTEEPASPVAEPTEESTLVVVETEVPTATEEPVSGPPKIGSITFALGSTADFEPISPAASFDEGITEIHAIFDYSGMANDFTWERVWYLDGEQILKNEAPWTDPASGRFDYFLDAGGDPLPAGDWLLEIYMQGELLASGEFTIKGEETPVAVVPDTPTPTASPAPTETPTPAPTKAASGGGVYSLVYSKWDGGQYNMFVANTNGSNETFLLNRAAGPSWSPDGQEIFFFGEEGVDRQKLADGREFVFDGVSNGIVAMVNAAARPSIEQAVLFQGGDWKQGSARWANVSPDGQMVAFDAKPGGDYRIYFLGTADNQQFRFEIVGEQADWSPDSQKIVYRSGRDGKTGIWISNRDDSGHTLITNGGSDSFPAWSPDGRTIAFSRDEGGNVDIYIMNTDGSNIRRLTDAPGPDTLPVYTPSGDIIFRSARSGSWGIWKMSGLGGGQVEIIPNTGVGNDWSGARMDVR